MKEGFLGGSEKLTEVFLHPWPEQIVWREEGGGLTCFYFNFFHLNPFFTIVSLQI